MAASNALSNMSLWIALGVVFALIVGPIGDFSSTLLIAVLIIQMTLSMDGLTFSKENFKKNRKQILFAVAACFIISMGVTLAVGYFFVSDYPNIWNGWVLLAAVPCAVSCVTMSFLLRGNTLMCVIALAVIYFIALVLTPTLTRMIIGESVSVLKIFSYVILFVVIPMAASVPMKKVKISRAVRVMAINVLIFMMVFLALGQNREHLFSAPGIVVLVIAACVIRIFGVSLVMLYLMKKKGTSRENAMVYLPMAVWKNSGLATTLCFVLFGSSAEAAIPCALSLLVEVLWFAVISNYMDKLWPLHANQPHADNG